jgi:hypothetical protein
VDRRFHERGRRRSAACTLIKEVGLGQFRPLRHIDGGREVDMAGVLHAVVLLVTRKWRPDTRLGRPQSLAAYCSVNVMHLDEP